MSRTSLQPAHKLKYGLKVMHIDPAIKRIVSVQCQFCVYFGKEDSGESRAWKQTESRHGSRSVQNYTKVIIRDSTLPIGLHIKHLITMPRRNYLIAFSRTLTRCIPISTPEISLCLSSSIAVIIGDVFFNPDDHGSVSHQRALALFVPEIGSDNAVQNNTVSAVLESCKLVLGVGKIGSISDAQVSNFARILVAVNFTILNEILGSPEVLGFSIALDSSTHHGVSYLAIRIRFHYKNLLRNIHVAALPMSERCTAVIYDHTVKVFNVLCPLWRKKVLGIASDGA
ncbi:hypothetical protein PsorP6_001045 [Peronosclerospora sorghi]|uniref:Uncharacterized protein n=1 Tax=Peronosclerospora sorghi TaxID=230839 RepID=A0ACC0WPF5_9STRA|nr:hypothetical protein PsorP6_001045 [Peronosclerospora sorghi]